MLKRAGADIIAEALARHPSSRLALGCQGSMIGEWIEELNCFYPIASETITGEWVRMPYAIRINGLEPAYQWQEIRRQP